LTIPVPLWIAAGKYMSTSLAAHFPPRRAARALSPRADRPVLQSGTTSRPATRSEVNRRGCLLRPPFATSFPKSPVSQYDLAIHPKTLEAAVKGQWQVKHRWRTRMSRSPQVSECGPSRVARASSSKRRGARWSGSPADSRQPSRPGRGHRSSRRRGVPRPTVAGPGHPPRGPPLAQRGDGCLSLSAAPPQRRTGIRRTRSPTTKPC
jgi:hypothetical protein